MLDWRRWIDQNGLNLKWGQGVNWRICWRHNFFLKQVKCLQTGEICEIGGEMVEMVTWFGENASDRSSEFWLNLRTLQSLIWLLQVARYKQLWEKSFDWSFDNWCPWSSLGWGTFCHLSDHLVDFGGHLLADQDLKREKFESSGRKTGTLVAREEREVCKTATGSISLFHQRRFWPTGEPKG